MAFFLTMSFLVKFEKSTCWREVLYSLGFWPITWGNGIHFCAESYFYPSPKNLDCECCVLRVF